MESEILIFILIDLEREAAEYYSAQQKEQAREEEISEEKEVKV